ncbi:hypothetical protein MKX01_021616 [Papaver californicum]|nr:hypothetical protein MKX01_021616 [Papaver californicum]
MPHDDIPNMFGRVLSGTKYGLKQTRGKFGLGAKMALIWSKMSTGLPIEISSTMRGQSYTTFCRLDIDIHRNIPHVHLHEKRDEERWHGAKIQVVIEGNWTTYHSKILHYMRQMAVIAPYAQFLFKFVSDIADKNVTIRFARRTDVMPPVPVETKHHPSAVGLPLIKRLITETSKLNLLQFLQNEFVNIGKPFAERLIGEMGPDFSPKTAVKSLTSQQIVRIHQLFRQAKFDDPSGNCLSPAGEYNLRLGIIKELHPDLAATYSGSPQVFEGHPFIVEAGVSLGGKDVKQGLNIFRFANRIPLLFEQGADVVTRTAQKRINWNNYKINQTQDRIGVFVSIVSTKIPFKGTRKEYIGDDISEIASAVKAAIQQCCIQLKSKIVKKIQAREQQERNRNLTRYIPDVTGAIYDVLRQTAQAHSSKKKPYDEEDAEILKQVSARLITKQTLHDKLAKHVEQVDYEMAVDYATEWIVKMAQRPQIAVLGAGIFVRTQYLPRLYEISDIMILKTIWSRTEESAKAADLARQYFPEIECKWGVADLEDIIKDTSIHGVAVVLAGQIQVDMSLRMLSAGKHVFQEKPAASAVSEAETAISHYRSLCANSLPHRPIWAVGDNYRFEPAFVECKNLLKEIGDMMSVQIMVEGSMNSSNPYFSSSWRRNFTGGFILDMGVHYIAGLRMMVGCEVTSVSAITSHVDTTLPPPDNISSIFELENGCGGVFVMVVSSRSPKIFWKVVGTKGSLQVERGNKDGKHGYTVLHYTVDGQCRSSFHPFSGVNEELKAFVYDISQSTLQDAGDHEAEPRSSFVEGARDIAVLQTMLESGMKKGAKVDVKKF